MDTALIIPFYLNVPFLYVPCKRQVGGAEGEGEEL